MKERIIGLDILRGTAIVIIIAIHAYALFSADTYITNPLARHAYKCIFNMGNALFIMISGALLLREVQPVSTFMQKRFSKIIIPFLIWSIVYYTAAICMHKYPEISNWKDALQMFVPYLFNNKINTLFWLIHLIIAIYLLTPLLQRAITGKKAATYAFCLWIGYMILRDIAPDIYICQISHSQLLMCTGIFIAGHYIYTYASDFRHATVYYACGFLLLYAINLAVNTWWHYCSTVTTLQTCCLFGAIVSLRIDTQRKWTGFAVKLSRYSFLIYFLHIFVLNAIILLFPMAGVHLLPFTTAIGVALICYIAGCLADLLPARYKHWIGI